MRTPRRPGHGPAAGPPGRKAARLPRGARGDLRRPADRLERALRVLLVTVALVAVPVAAWSAGQAAYDHCTHVRETQLARLRPVEARLVADARSGGDRPGERPGFHAAVRWSDERGSHTADVPVSAWLDRGATATVWLDARGDVSEPPQATDLAASVGVAVASVVAIGGAGLGHGLSRALAASFDRRRLTGWGREWERVEPTWAKRYGH